MRQKSSLYEGIFFEPWLPISLPYVSVASYMLLILQMFSHAKVSCRKACNSCGVKDPEEAAPPPPNEDSVASTEADGTDADIEEIVADDEEEAAELAELQAEMGTEYHISEDSESVVTENGKAKTEIKDEL